MLREDGHYWVSEYGAEPEVAMWRGGAWLLAGQEEGAASPAITVLSERLIPPESNPVRDAAVTASTLFG